MKFLSLFAGIGGFDLGLERAGMECVGQVEYNPFCQKILKKHWPHVKLVGDIHDVTETDFGAVDLVCGGFPCQSFSTAGKRKGTTDERYLWPEMYRLIQSISPAWVIAENVRGLLSIENGMVFETVCANLEAGGYDVQSFIIPACGLGACHRRERIFFVAHSKIQRGGREQGTFCGEDGRSERRVLSEPLYANSNVSNSEEIGLQRIVESLPEKRQKSDDKQLHGCSGDWNKSWVEVATRLCRVDDGIPGGMDRAGKRVKNYRADRLKALGNSVVPQIVEVIGRAIIESSIGVL